ncbi:MULTISPECIES: porin family protein [unclassified Cellulophaga]|uniref:porin family protein n=1 Tax=unclassified Cellulophaga TaxID=2634405 RepID=UPI0026E257B9|nr:MULTISPECIES: porin family protein [unclassified Cellulophaga]MDO6493016.1 porin family protein [Cellulophaga sp. 2_MG-2023]MDO6495992.1 porin family protein [Cellulophaga sp. 3_MG-2023]
MKKTLLVITMALASLTTFAQTDASFGIKGGLNYGGNGDYYDSAKDAYNDPDKNVGFHFGIFAQTGGNLYLRPELVYTSLKSGYAEDFKMQKLDLPVLVGAKVIGPVNVFAGPAFQYILGTDYDGITIGDVENDFTVGLNVGVGVNLGKLGVDIRYERGFSDNEVDIINADITSVQKDRIDTRPDQLILSLSLKL